MEKKLWISNELRTGLLRSLYGRVQYPRLEKFELAGEKIENQRPFFCIRTQNLMIQHLARENETTGSGVAKRTHFTPTSVSVFDDLSNLIFFTLGGRNFPPVGLHVVTSSRPRVVQQCPTRNLLSPEAKKCFFSFRDEEGIVCLKPMLIRKMTTELPVFAYGGPARSRHRQLIGRIWK